MTARPESDYISRVCGTVAALIVLLLIAKGIADAVFGAVDVVRVMVPA
jgi:hypothetical protein